MTSNPTVFVLMATYNGEKFLTQQLDSILSQTYQNFKIYISDDNSSDSTVEILFAYQQKHPESFFYSVNEKNIGYVKNFEKLLLNCSCNYIALSDQDDIWAKNKLEMQMKEMLVLELLNKTKPCLIHSDLSMIDEYGKEVETSYFKYRNYKLRSTKDLGHIFGPCGVMGNTIVMNQKLRDLVLEFPDELDSHDYWIAVNCELFGVRKTLNMQLVQYRIHSKNISNSLDSLSQQNSLEFKRDIKLPNLETKRKFYLPILESQIKSTSDKKVFDAYIDYLEFKKNRLLIYVNLLKYSLLKRDILFKVKVFIKILFTNRY